MVTAVFQWLMVSMVAVAHPFFISMTDIKHNAANKTLEVSVRIFTDDFEKALENRCKCKVDLVKPADKAMAEKWINDYINSRLQVKIDGQPAMLQFVGYQQEEASTWSYFEVKNIPAVKKIDINNALLYEYKPEQINMVHAKANGKEKTDKLDNPTRNISFQF